MAKYSRLENNLTMDFDPADSSYMPPADPPAPPALAPVPPPPEQSPREKANAQAIKTAALLETQNIPAVGAFRELLKRFTGKGGIISSQDSKGQYFTPYETTRLITDMLYVQSGSKILDPTCGTGRFFEYLPDGAEATGIEIDPDAARIAKLLYPQHNIECADILNNLHFRECFDSVMGNPPFGLWWSIDPKKSNLASAAGKIVSQWKILEAGMIALKPGGVLAFVVPQNTFTNERAADERAARFWKTNCIIRAEINLPKSAFKESGTEWPCSIVILQKPPAAPAPVFKYDFTDIKDIRQHEDCILKYRTSDTFTAMIDGAGKLLKDRPLMKACPPKINTAHVQAKKEFEIVYTGELPDTADEDIIYARRAGYRLNLKPNSVMAALKLEQWKESVNGYSDKKVWKDSAMLTQ